MNLKQVTHDVNYKRAFTRPDLDGWFLLWTDPSNNTLWFSEESGPLRVSIAQHIFADDFELKEPSVSITRKQFFDAAECVLPSIEGNDLNQLTQGNFKRLAKELGFE